MVEYRDMTLLQICHQKYHELQMTLHQNIPDLRDQISTDRFYWNNYNIHIVSTTWGSTSCGWGGMGGSAITTSLSYIFEQTSSGLSFVYWGNTLAYIIKTEDLDLKSIPSLSKAKSIWSNTKRLPYL